MKKNRIREGQFHFVMQGTPVIESVKNFIFKAKTNGVPVRLVPENEESDLWSVKGEYKNVRIVKEAFYDFEASHQNPLSNNFLMVLE